MMQESFGSIKYKACLPKIKNKILSKSFDKTF